MELSSRDSGSSGYGAVRNAEETVPRAKDLASQLWPEPTPGVLRPLDGGPSRMRALGYINRGGTLDVFGMLFANRCTWAHALAATAGLPKNRGSEFLSQEECLAVDGRGDPYVLKRA